MQETTHISMRALGVMRHRGAYAKTKAEKNIQTVPIIEQDL